MKLILRKIRASQNHQSLYDQNRCVERIMRIHHEIIVEGGEEREQGLEDTVINPMAIEGFCDMVGAYDNCFSKAALAMDYIVNFHPFAEGNKRTGFQVSLALLRLSGYELNDDEKTFLFIKAVAQGKYDRNEIEEWLVRNTHVSTSSTSP